MLLPPDGVAGAIGPFEEPAFEVGSRVVLTREAGHVDVALLQDAATASMGIAILRCSKRGIQNLLPSVCKRQALVKAPTRHLLHNIPEDVWNCCRSPSPLVHPVVIVDNALSAGSGQFLEPHNSRCKTVTHFVPAIFLQTLYRLEQGAWQLRDSSLTGFALLWLTIFSMSAKATSAV